MMARRRIQISFIRGSTSRTSALPTQPSVLYERDMNWRGGSEHAATSYDRSGLGSHAKCLRSIPYLDFATRKVILDTVRIQRNPLDNPEHLRRLTTSTIFRGHLFLDASNNTQRIDLAFWFRTLFEEPSPLFFSLISSLIRSIPVVDGDEELEDIKQENYEKEFNAATGPDRGRAINWDLIMFGSPTDDTSEVLGPEWSIHPRGVQIVRSGLFKWRG